MSTRQGETLPGPALVVMAAGMGSRYGGLKQIDPIGPHGEIIIDYSVYDALLAGFERVVFVIKKDIEKDFRARVGRTIERRCETDYVFQELEDVPAGFTIPPDRQKPWGTAHATLCCQRVVHSSFAVINADDFYGRSSFQTLCDYLRTARDRDGTYDYCMVGYVLENTLTEHGHVARGICTVSRDGFLVEVRERTQIEKSVTGAKYSEDGETWIELPGDTIVSMNMWGFTPGVFTELGTRFRQFLQENSDRLQTAECFLPDVVNDLLKEKKTAVRVLPTAERWFGVTYPQDKLRVKQAIQDLIGRNIYPGHLWESYNES